MSAYCTVFWIYLRRVKVCNSNVGCSNIQEKNHHQRLGSTSFQMDDRMNHAHASFQTIIKLYDPNYCFILFQLMCLYSHLTVWPRGHLPMGTCRGRIINNTTPIMCKRRTCCTTANEYKFQLHITAATTLSTCMHIPMTAYADTVKYNRGV